MKDTFTIPINTPYTDPDNRSLFSFSWTTYFKMLGDEVVSYNLIKNSQDSKNFKYVLNGALCTCNYYVETAATSDVTLTLPYTAQCAFEIFNTIYPPLTTKITIPAGQRFIQFYYMVKF